MKPKIVFIENEPWSGQFVEVTLGLLAFDILWKKDTLNVLPEIIDFQPDLCIIDIMMNGISEYDLCRQIKSDFPLLPLIFLTNDHKSDVIVKGFLAGGTCFLPKPYHHETLLDQIKIQLQPKPDNFLLSAGFSEDIRLGNSIFSPDMCKLSTPQESITLSMREMQLLLVLSKNINCLVERRTLLIEIWGDDSFLNSRNLDVYIRKLRQRLLGKTNLNIHTIKGKGYLLLVGIV